MRIRLATGFAVALAAAGAAAQWGAAGPALIFFDWGKSELSGDARSDLDRVVGDFRKQPRTLTLDGHSDRSGTSASNLESSRRRAAMVRDYLAAKGVPGAMMTVRAYGESWPIIATADGVREVQNRRVEIRWGDAVIIR